MIKMKRKYFLLLLPILLLPGIFILNINVTSQQCIDFECRAISLPLYLKIINFFDRHCNYKHMVKGIITDANNDEEKVKKIFEWTYKNIKRVPQGLPVIDDHIWYTIVRGYAANDQFSDIFSTLCNYAGIKAFFRKVHSRDSQRVIVLSYAKIRDNWFVFDPYNGTYFKDKNGKFCKIEDIRLNNCGPVDIEGKPRFDIDYTIYFDDILSKGNTGLSRASIQSPLNRLVFELNKPKK